MEKSAVKNFMGKLLREDIFDDFCVRTVDILTNTRFSVDGTIVKETIEDGDEKQKKSTHTTWGALRPMLFEIIKISSKPRQFKIVFSFKNPLDLHNNAAALFLNFVYENDSISFTTASAQKDFALDKTLDITWEEWVRNFLKDYHVKNRE